MRIDARILAGTATLGALTVVLDYTWKYSSMKIQFPPLSYLRFDFTGIPIVVATLLFGLIPGVVTSLVATLAILARSGDVLGSFMKGLAEFSTILGIALGLRFSRTARKPVSSFFGIAFRILTMMVANLIAIFVGILPLREPLIEVTLLTGVFNAIQGALSVYGGFFIFEVMRRRAPHIEHTLTNRPRELAHCVQC